MRSVAPTLALVLLAAASAAAATPTHTVLQYDGFCSSGGLQLSRAARADRAELALCEARPDSFGGAFLEQAVPAKGGFACSFEFYIVAPAAPGKPNGFALVLQSLSSSVFKNGNGNMGFGGLPGTVALVLDRGPGGGWAAALAASPRPDKTVSAEPAEENVHPLAAGTDLASGKAFRANVTYTPGTLGLRLSDGSSAVWPLRLNDSVPADGGVFFGFTTSPSEDGGAYGSPRLLSVSWAVTEGERPDTECAAGFQPVDGRGCFPVDRNECALATSCGSCLRQESCCQWCGGECVTEKGAHPGECAKLPDACPTDEPGVMWFGVAAAVAMALALAAAVTFVYRRLGSSHHHSGGQFLHLVNYTTGGAAADDGDDGL